MTVTTIGRDIAAAVTRLYEAFPYPHYPLLGRPLWQDGYLTPSKFAARLFEDLTGQEASINTARGQFVRQGRTILVAGSGEILPYVIRKNEPAAHRLLCVDLSQRSLNRARFRLLANLRSTQFIRADINTFLEQQGAVSGPYDHIDAYGVLHHLANPTATVRALSLHLAGNGTMRVMVYNARARRWIHHLQAVFRLLKLSPYQTADLNFARRLLKVLSDSSPFYEQKLSQMGQSTLGSNSRLTDTFFHCRETRIDIESWIKMFEDAGLKPFALVDRYGELDDLPNPMWNFPSAKELQRRAQSDQFANNLEIFLYKPRQLRPLTKDYSYERRPDRVDIFAHYLKPAPRLWYQYPETSSVSRLLRLKFWWQHVDTAYRITKNICDPLLKKIPLPAAKRLARVGAIFPSQVSDKALFEKLSKATLESEATTTDTFDRANFSKLPLAKVIEEELQRRNIMSSRRYQLILRRLNAGQF
jgi:2-polyprenyl-3-methyl-5-hydroxy-6-metoxy-1,4-benzoquinol methylase